jgi:hypothetical protein
MDETAITEFITDTFEGAELLSATGTTFFFYGNERKFPFATLTTTDEHDQFSDLNRPGVFRLNVGLSKASFQSLFSSAEECDFTVTDRIMPHPVYGKMYWVCVVCPSGETFERVKSLLAEGYALAKKRYDRNNSTEV